MTQKFKISIGVITPIVIILLSIYVFCYIFGLNPKVSSFYIEIVLLITSILLIYFFTKCKIIYFNLSKIELKNFFKIAIVSYIVAFLLQFISGLTYHIFLNPLHKNIDKQCIFEILFLLFIFPLSNELMFRGFLLNMLESLRKYTIRITNNIVLSFSVLISGIISGGIILPYLIFNQYHLIVIFTTISATIMGVLAGYFQEKYNNFTAALLVNYSYTLVSVVGIIISIIIN